MFGFSSSTATQLFQGSVTRTWNCVTQFTNLLWYKFNHYRHPIMPRSRRRHHSRSRSRSRSHSHDRDRDVKRRKIDNVDSPAHKRSVSAEPEIPEPLKEAEIAEEIAKEESQQTDKKEKDKITPEKEAEIVEGEQSGEEARKTDKNAENSPESSDKKDTNEEKKESTDKITPKKPLSAKQLQKKAESEKKRQQKQMEREEREKKKQEEKERIRLEKEQLKKEKEELIKKKNEEKAKEREMKEEQKRKEREEKEAKRKEKEEREELKRKEREQEKLKKQQEQEEKNREKKKIEEQKQKAAQAFVNFFVPKKSETKVEEGKTEMFKPFQVKSDMRLAPLIRRNLTEEEKTILSEFLNNNDEAQDYLKELKVGKSVGKSWKTWPYEDDDVMVVEEDFGESICEDKQKMQKMRVKFLKFHENRRPPYYGTWRKKSPKVTGRNPFGEDKTFFDYDVDSDDDWEEEEQGESLNGSDDEEKENEAENEDYEVDNDFFVPHGHLSDDEVDDEDSAKLSPESHKEKLKLLKDEFDLDMQTKTNKMKPRSIGCIWYNRDRSNVDVAIDRHLRPLAMITNCQIVIKKRKDQVVGSNKKVAKELRQELVPVFLKLVHGNSSKKAALIEEFLTYMQTNGLVVDFTKTQLGKCLKQFAQWKRCQDEGPMFNKYCWCVEDDVKKKYNFE